MGGVTVEVPLAIVVIRRGRCAGFVQASFIRFDASEREMRVEPAELSVVELRMQRNLVAHIFWNMQTIVRGVRRARRNQMHVNYRARRPGVPLIDGIAVPVNLQGTIEMCTRLDQPLTAVFDFSAPENCLPFFIAGLQLKPYIECVHRAAGEEVPDFARAYNYIPARESRALLPRRHGGRIRCMA